jgi:hypothetical protein
MATSAFLLAVGFILLYADWHHMGAAAFIGLVCLMFGSVQPFLAFYDAAQAWFRRQ